MPGVYGPFTVSGQSGVSVVGAGGRIGGESVFVDGAGGPFAAWVSGATGVRISNLTLRNAQVALDLADAGVGGSVAGSGALRTRLDRLIIHSFSVAGIQMTRTSTAVAERLTIAAPAGAGPHFRLVGAGDATPLDKLQINNSLVIAPLGAAAFTWFLPTETLADFSRPGPDSGLTFVDGAPPSDITAWTPAVSAYLPRPSLAFRDESQNIYTSQNPARFPGYHSDRPFFAEAYVSPNYWSGVPAVVEPEVTTFRSIQAAINSGLKRIRLAPGIYREAFYLADGVELIGAGTDQTIIELPPGSARPAVQAEGVRGVSIANLTITAPGGTALSARDGARLRLSRAVIRDSVTAIALDGPATDVEIVNATIVRNGDGVSATGNAPVRVRNTNFASNTGAALSYQSAAATTLHQYNNYFANGVELRVDGAAQPAAGPGEIVQDPRFNSAATNDFRLLPDSGLIDAGSPGDPAPPGTGRTDIGHIEWGLGAFYVSAAYCPTCANDGLQWFVNAFDDIGAATFMAGQARARACGSATDCRLQLDVNVAPGTYVTGALGITLPSGVRLLGSGADTTTIVAGGGATAIQSIAASDLEISGFTIRGATGAGAAGINISGGQNILVSRNLIRDNSLGVVFSAGVLGEARLNTIVNNGVGISADGGATSIAAVSNIIAGSGGAGAQARGGATLALLYNLLNANSPDLDGASDDVGNLLGQSPLFVDAAANNFALQAGSPAVNAADPRIAGWAGDERADIGYRELIAPPVVLLLGTPGQSCAAATSGVASVEVGQTTVSDPTTAPESTLPGAWQSAALAVPGATASDWSATLTTDGNGLRRIYSRATDALGNQEQPEVAYLDRFGERLPAPALNLYDGAYYADSTAPTVSLITAAGPTTASELTLEATVSDADPTCAFSVEAPYFLVNGAYVAARFAPGASGSTRRFQADLRLERGASYTITAYAADGVGNLASSGPITLTNTLNPDPTIVPQVEVISPRAGTIFEGTTITVRGRVTWTHPEQRNVFVLVTGTSGCNRYQSSDVVLDDPYGDTTTWTVVVTPDWSECGEVPLWIYARDANGDSASTFVTVYRDREAPYFDTLPATRTISQPVTLSGTAYDNPIPDPYDPPFYLWEVTNIAQVEVSSDGGSSWQPTDFVVATRPLTRPLTLTIFSARYTPAPGLDFVPVPVQFRATDLSGQTTVATTTLVVDNEPPALAPPSFNLAPGSYLDSIQSLVMSWQPPIDGSGQVTVTAAINQSSSMVPDAVQAGTSLSQSLDAAGAWYAHLSAVDALGNRSSQTVGPWYVRLGGMCAAPARNLSLDGRIDTAAGEWRAVERLDDDERPVIANPAGGDTQELYVTWDANALYLGWQGARWGVDGTLYAYLRSSSGATSTALIAPTAAGNNLPFAADTAVAVSGPEQGQLYRVVGGTWQPQGAISVANGASRASELRVPILGGLAASGEVRLLAFAQIDGGEVVSLFPTSNPLDGPWTDSYRWAPICAVDEPNAGQPTRPSVVTSMSIAESDGAPYAPGQLLTHVIALRNYERRPVTDATLSLTTTIGLGLTSLEAGPGVSCSSCPPGGASWALSVPSLAANATLTLTATGQLVAPPADVAAVTSTLRLSVESLETSRSTSRRLDGAGPAVSISDLPLAPGEQSIFGLADDGDGIGVERVEVNVAGAGWQRASGDTNWSLPVLVGNGASLSVQVRAIDRHGQVGPVLDQTFVVDREIPEVSITAPAVVTGPASLFTGIARDLPTGGPLDSIEVALNGGGWQAALRDYLRDPATGSERYAFAIASLRGDGVRYTVQARATDLTGNQGLSEPQSFVLDNVPPSISMTRLLTQVDPASPAPVLRIAASDGSGVAAVEVRVHGPDGSVFTEAATFDGVAWVYTPARPLPAGLSSLRVFARDIHGNTSTAGSFDLTSGTPEPPTRKIYLPLVAAVAPATRRTTRVERRRLRRAA